MWRHRVPHETLKWRMACLQVSFSDPIQPESMASIWSALLNKISSELIYVSMLSCSNLKRINRYALSSLWSTISPFLLLPLFFIMIIWFSFISLVVGKSAISSARLNGKVMATLALMRLFSISCFDIAKLNGDFVRRFLASERLMTFRQIFIHLFIHCFFVLFVFCCCLFWLLNEKWMKNKTATNKQTDNQTSKRKQKETVVNGWPLLACRV